MFVVPKRKESLVVYRNKISKPVYDFYDFYDYNALTNDLINFKDDLKKRHSQLNIYYLDYITTN